MTIILVTGLIGSGKSAACSYLSELGYPVYDSDSRTKAMYESVPGFKSRIEETLGVPFSELSVIFRDSAKRTALESMVYPLVLEDFKHFARESGSDVVFFESAIALEKPQFEGLFDKVVLVRAPLSLRSLRNPKAAEREPLQHEVDPKSVDYVIENDSGLDELRDRVDSMIKHFKI